ncbi:hypothetical protein [Kaistella palustris]|uniref:hypothetical protein n=1 Tax=Kaistella palustris TaxID=493376 RepID=UPI00040D03F1|nr:hypothetical protein [Kaistella palustris]
MKKLIVLLPVLLFSCNKKEAVTETSANRDSAVAVDHNEVEKPFDSTATGITTLPHEPAKNASATFRVAEGNKIIKTINGDAIPLKISDEFTTDDQSYILKIKNFTNRKITGKIVPENSAMNIRFNQIKLADGSYDGPFGREISYDVPKPGEIWLLVSKSNMASGETRGKFTIGLK